MTDDSEEIQFSCPSCSRVIEMNGCEKVCVGCGMALLVDGDIYDFVGATKKYEEKSFYDGEYGKSYVVERKTTLDDLESIWKRPYAPQDALVRKMLGDIKAKTVVMLGNGASQKELAFLKDHPKRLVYSDLSPNAAMRIKANVDYGEYQGILRFAAIDAEHLPFVDSSVDVVYAYAMVHHLPNLDRFFQEVIRVLKPGGKAIFMDDAYSPIWHFSKQTWLKPLMKRSHARTGISPEDYRFSMSGGFREELLSESIRRAGGSPFFERAVFFGYIVERAAEKVFPASMTLGIKNGWIQKAATGVDNLMSGFRFFRQNQIRLVWGFDK